MSETATPAKALVASLGGLRDAVVTDLRWRIPDRQLALSLRGGDPGELIFHEVCSVFMTADPVQESLPIYEMWIAEENEARVVAEIKFRPGGTLTVNCGEISLGTTER